MTTQDAASAKAAGPVMREHPARRQVFGEMHLRRWPAVPVPGLVIQWRRLARSADMRGVRPARGTVVAASGAADFAADAVDRRGGRRMKKKILH